MDDPILRMFRQCLGAHAEVLCALRVQLLDIRSQRLLEHCATDLRITYRFNGEPPEYLSLTVADQELVWARRPYALVDEMARLFLTRLRQMYEHRVPVQPVYNLAWDFRIGTDHAADERIAYFDPEEDYSPADLKAKELFRKVVGRKAVALLDKGKGVPVQGSAGGSYTLRKRASYCITRVDGVKFCAVVPGVPLWDHLLGIKLMVENDEPTFLRVANKL